jgi:hypothetical protein
MAPTTAVRNQQILDQFLNPVRDIPTPEVAKAIADLRAEPATQERIEDLAHGTTRVNSRPRSWPSTRPSSTGPT